jgi:hypothetical protein
MPDIDKKGVVVFSLVKQQIACSKPKIREDPCKEIRGQKASP